jgi:hypothetical protein
MVICPGLSSLHDFVSIRHREKNPPNSEKWEPSTSRRQIRVPVKYSPAHNEARPGMLLQKPQVELRPKLTMRT